MKQVFIVYEVVRKAGYKIVNFLVTFLPPKMCKHVVVKTYMNGSRIIYKILTVIVSGHSY